MPTRIRHRKRNKYMLYQQSVQSPKENADFLAATFQELRGRPAHAVREDFCGSFLQASEWVRRDPANTAIAIDLDPEVLAYGSKHQLTRLERAARKRLSVRRQNVLAVTRPAVDLAFAFNYSFYALKRWDRLEAYCRACHRSLKRDGILLLEMVGGPGFIEKLKETRKVRPGGRGWFIVVWHQKSFDPIAREGQYAIHFKFPDGSWMKDAFTYDWRVWTVPEVRTALELAGFAKSVVYWEQTDRRGRGTEEYKIRESAENDWAWTCYVVGLK
jgi:SAM-dependent methyltransferase